ncbi:HAD family hydrolase [Pleomorphomonas carboxyditropha]|uniref:Hydrolase n=1 Tax=Pleomorphomonas carboxyditropha TaxID=2023338 RepID=A0A2G9WTY6_9HYPH|nr:hypothetical protein [Pleomorphomonas carboxyditropha]PIO98159.1 hypothetical protein CJ014_15985 [Pleomorphomonas carboxyditropha]
MFIETDRMAPTTADRMPLAIVSFDVFDTMLLRRCTTPSGVFELACRLAGCDTARPGLVESFTQHRSLAEAKARKAAFKKTGNGEVSIEQIYARFPRQLFGLGDISPEALAEAEFQAELNLCVANPDILSFYRSAREAGKRTGFVSDTYWNGERLGRLLRAAIPGLAWDFLYASCDHGSSKSENLFRKVIAAEKPLSHRMLHVGDNPAADIEAPRRLGIETHHHRQASTYFAGLLQREGSTFALLSPTAAHGQRLDDGLRSLRRCVANRLATEADAFALGATILGPVMAAFDCFVSEEIEKLSVDGRQVAVAFLARDGFLPYRVWTAHSQQPVGYAEINRRAAALAAVDNTTGFTPLFAGIEQIDHAATIEMIGADSPGLRAFFARQPGGIVDGEALCLKLPTLLGKEAIGKLARSMRTGLLEHMRQTIPGFDSATDLVLVDLGYRGSVQKGLRQAMKAAGLRTRLHGLYLLTKDDSLEADDGDTARGFIDDLVVSPQTKLTMLSNIAVLEQLCSAAAGSVRSYRNGEPIREPDVRDAGQIELSRQAQAGAIHFVQQLGAFKAGGLDPFANAGTRAAWAATLLARLLLMPTDDELMLLGSTRHDINLGTKAVVPLADPTKAADWMVAWTFSEAAGMPVPPMWPAGSFSAIAPADGFSYLLKGCGLLSREIHDDIPCGQVEVTLVDKTAASLAKITCRRTGNNDLRLHIPLSVQQGIEAVAIPLGQIAPRGLLRGVTLQQHDKLLLQHKEADVERLGAERLHAVDIRFDGELFAAEADGKLVIMLPPLEAKYGIVSVLLSPLTEGRPMSLAMDNADHAPAAWPSLDGIVI